MNDIQSLEYQKISSKQAPDSAMLFFHGYGDSAGGFGMVAWELKDLLPCTVFYSVQAPIEIFPGGYGWFIISDEEFRILTSAPEKLDGIVHGMLGRTRHNISKVHALTEYIAEKEGIPFGKISYTGFSQGGLIAMISGLSFKDELSGITAMSSVPLTYGEHFSHADIINKPDVLLTHATGDNLVPFRSLSISKASLEEAGISVRETVLQGLDHNFSINKEVIDSLVSFSIRNK